MTVIGSVGWSALGDDLKKTVPGDLPVGDQIDVEQWCDNEYANHVADP